MITVLKLLLTTCDVFPRWLLTALNLPANCTVKSSTFELLLTLAQICWSFSFFVLCAWKLPLDAHFSLVCFDAHVKYVDTRLNRSDKCAQGRCPSALLVRYRNKLDTATSFCKVKFKRFDVQKSFLAARGSATETTNGGNRIRINLHRMHSSFSARSEMCAAMPWDACNKCFARSSKNRMRKLILTSRRLVRKH